MPPPPPPPPPPYSFLPCSQFCPWFRLVTGRRSKFSSLPRRNRGPLPLLIFSSLPLCFFSSFSPSALSFSSSFFYRAVMLTKLVDVAHECLKLNNFETVHFLFLLPPFLPPFFHLLLLILPLFSPLPPSPSSPFPFLRSSSFSLVSRSLPSLV